MLTRYLLDTNICIYIQRQKPAEVLARFQKLKPGDAASSVITWGELLYGAENSLQRKKALQLLEEFKTLLPVLTMPDNAGQTYGAIRASWRENSHFRGISEALIFGFNQFDYHPLFNGKAKEFD